MMHRLECDASAECGCGCRCHERCLALMACGERCHRLTGHGPGHRSRWAVEYDRAVERGEIQHARSVIIDLAGDGCESNTLRAGARSSAITRERASLVSVEVMAR